MLKHKGGKEIKLVDFGLARKLEPGVELREMMGTPEFAGKYFISVWLDTRVCWSLFQQTLLRFWF